MRQQVTRQEIRRDDRREKNREIDRELGRDVRREPGLEEDRSRRRSKRKRRSSRRSEEGSLAVLTLIWLIVLLIFIGIGVGIGWFIWGRPQTGKGIDLKSVEAPSWVEQDFIRKNIYSRPAVSLKEVNGIVIHYVANPGSTAKQNRDYFDNLADQKDNGTSASAHFIVGLEGEVIQAIPVSEMAYASNNRNSDTIAIESCHPDETGKYEPATYDSMVKLTAWLCRELELNPQKDIIRHYDINGKACPKYFVDHEEAWKQFLKDVESEM